MNRRVARLNHLFQEELSELIRDIKDPRMAAIVSITRVDASPDLETAQVYVSIMGDADEKRDTIDALTHAAPYLKRELLHRVSLRHVPMLHFVLDRTIEEAAHVLELMRRVVPEEAPKAE